MSTSESKISPELALVLPRRIAHALRTPLGLVAAALQELDVTKGGDPLLGLGHRGVRQLSHLADRLGLLGRLAVGKDAGRGEQTPIDLAAVVKLVVEDVAEVRPRRRVETTVQDLPADVRVHGNAECLRAALVELVDNATRFARTTVTVSMRTDEDRAIVEIRDDGPGPSATTSKGPKAGSLGIGLVLVRIICAQHSADFELCDADAGGGLARISLDFAHS